MKKIIIAISVLLLTGCLGETGKGYITKECTKTDSINGKIVETKILIKSKQGKIENITITEKYDKNLDLESITNSKISEKNAYKNIKLDIMENMFTYTIEPDNLTEEEIEKFNVKNEQHKQVNYYESNGYTCKK